MDLLKQIVAFMCQVEKIGVSKDTEELFIVDAHELSTELRKESVKLADEFDMWVKAQLS